MTFDLDRQIENRMSRRLRSEPLAVAKANRQIDAAEALIGRLIRDGKPVFYINQLRRNGVPTGKTVEFKYRDQAIDYLTRNKYL